jgi:hypothetical protein
LRVLKGYLQVENETASLNTGTAHTESSRAKCPIGIKHTDNVTIESADDNLRELGRAHQSHLEAGYARRQLLQGNKGDDLGALKMVQSSMPSAVETASSGDV